MSTAARRKIAAAQRARWAKWKTCPKSVMHRRANALGLKRRFLARFTRRKRSGTWLGLGPKDEFLIDSVVPGFDHREVWHSLP